MNVGRNHCRSTACQHSITAGDSKRESWTNMKERSALQRQRTIARLPCDLCLMVGAPGHDVHQVPPWARAASELAKVFYQSRKMSMSRPTVF
eukprot:scaffold155268_cov42-Tisochrysis_lutea.AAC.2